MQTCGDLLYGDFREAKPGSLDDLAARLNEHSGQGSQQGPQQGVSKSLQTPPKAHSRHGAPPLGWNMPDGTGSSNPNDPAKRAAVGDPSVSNTQQRQFLQLCIETGKFTLELSEVDVDQPDSDGVLFEKIRKQYEQIRYSILPMRLRFRKPDKAIFIKACIIDSEHPLFQTFL